MSVLGRITKWDDEKGFGFIARASGGNQIFFHIKALPRGTKRPFIGAEVTCEVIIDADGRRKAGNVKLVSGQTLFGPTTRAFIVSGVFLAFVAAAVVYGYLPVIVFYAYLGMSILSLFMYAIDKSAATKGRQRTRENTLHLLSLGGGWPGALFAQQFLRHKTVKKPFRVVFWATVIINISALLFLPSPHSSIYLAKLQSWLNIAPPLFQKGSFFDATDNKTSIYLCQNKAGEKFAQSYPCPEGLILLRSQ